METLVREDLAWVVRRMPRVARTALKEAPAKVFLAGGFVRACVAREVARDVDLFVGEKEHARSLAVGLALDRGRKHRIVETENAFTVTGFRPAIQIIHRWIFDGPEKCISSFDFSICAAALWWSTSGWCSVVHPRFYADLAAKRLTYLSPVREEAPGGSMLRILKYYQRGYRISLPSLAKVIARCVQNGPSEPWPSPDARIILTRLREVDPLVDPNHDFHWDVESELDDPEGAIEAGSVVLQGSLRG